MRAAYASGLDVMLWVCAGIALAAAVLALLFLPRQTSRHRAGRRRREPGGGIPRLPGQNDLL